VVFGGAFLITPGFITDVIGALLLVPPTRSLFRRLLIRRLGRRIQIRTSRRNGRAYDFEGTATDYDTPPPRLER
jgi:UPF0716 protein FxsA